MFLNSDLLLLLELYGGALKVSVKKKIFFGFVDLELLLSFSDFFCFWALLCCCCVCVCFVFGFQSKGNCVVLFALCWFVEQLNCAVLFWFPEQVNCVLCESRERDREEVKVALSVESAPTLFFLVFGGGGVD